MRQRNDHDPTPDDRRRDFEAAMDFAAYEYAQTRRVALCLRAVAAELDQAHPETETPSDRRRRASGCLEKLRESEQILGEVATQPWRL